MLYLISLNYPNAHRRDSTMPSTRMMSRFVKPHQVPHNANLTRRFSRRVSSAVSTAFALRAAGSAALFTSCALSGSWLRPEQANLLAVMPPGDPPYCCGTGWVRGSASPSTPPSLRVSECQRAHLSAALLHRDRHCSVCLQIAFRVLVQRLASQATRVYLAMKSFTS